MIGKKDILDDVFSYKEYERRLDRHTDNINKALGIYTNIEAQYGGISFSYTEAKGKFESFVVVFKDYKDYFGQTKFVCKECPLSAIVVILSDKKLSEAFFKSGMANKLPLKDVIKHSLSTNCISDFIDVINTCLFLKPDVNVKIKSIHGGFISDTILAFAKEHEELIKEYEKRKGIEFMALSGAIYTQTRTKFIPKVKERLKKLMKVYSKSKPENYKSFYVECRKMVEEFDNLFVKEMKRMMK